MWYTFSIHSYFSNSLSDPVLQVYIYQGPWCLHEYKIPFSLKTTKNGYLKCNGCPDSEWVDLQGDQPAWFWQGYLSEDLWKYSSSRSKGPWPQIYYLSLFAGVTSYIAYHSDPYIHIWWEIPKAIVDCVWSYPILWYNLKECDCSQHPVGFWQNTRIVYGTIVLYD